MPHKSRERPARGESFFRMCIKLAGAGVPLNRGIELLGVEGLEPRAKARKLARGELFDGFLDAFGGGHVGNIAFALSTEKGVRHSNGHLLMADCAMLIRQVWPLGAGLAGYVAGYSARFVVHAAGGGLVLGLRFRIYPLT
jgi:hypothetical protein